MADKLTPQQAQAVSDRGGKLLVSAAAGSGKTKVLVDRLLSYLTDPVYPANLDEFLIITYTKAAASELRGKIAAKLTERIAEEPENRHLQKQMQRLYLAKISTVHGFCSDVLREYAYKLNLAADFRVADENECREIRETVMADLLDQTYRNTDDVNFISFVDTQGIGRDDRLIPELIMKVYDASRCHLDPEGWLEKCIADSAAGALTDVSETVWGQTLIDDLHIYLEKQILVLRQCASELESLDGMEKPAANLRDTLYQLEVLQNCTTWDAIVEKRGIDYGRLTFPRKNNFPEATERIKAVRGACKKGLEKKLHTFSDDSQQVFSDLKQCASGVRGLVALVRQFDDMYTRAKTVRRVLDFSDLEHKTLDLLLGKSRANPTAAAREIGQRYREIMVDEYQDSNGVQDAIFDALTREKQNCFLVGDVKQSIYQFRLADPGIFLEKYHSYVPAGKAELRQGRKVLLSHNFRSGGEVIEAVNDVFRCCMSPLVGGLEYGEEEALREGIPHESMPDAAIELHALDIREDTYTEEAAFVADKIHGMLQTGAVIRGRDGFRRVEPEDIVILLRSPGSVGSHFQRALEARGIRCTSGGGGDLLETEEIGTFRAFLQTIVNPRQDIPLISILASPVFGFTADDLAQVRSRQRKGCFYDALLESGLPKADAFLEILTVLRQEARMHPLTQLLESCIQRTRLDSIYAAMPGGSAKSRNLQIFFQLAAEYEKNAVRDLNQFLEHLDALEGKGLIAAGTSAEGCVTIMSIHKSKGLEFPVVFLCGLSRSFNRESLQAQILCDKDLGLGLSVADLKNRLRYPSVAKRAIMVKTAQQSLSEEMRVLYVAMTRARDRLIMTYAVKNLQSDLQDIAIRMNYDNGRLLCMDAVCPGEWVMLAAMHRMEAGELHALGGRPDRTEISRCPWKICVSEAPETAEGREVVREEAAVITQEDKQLLKEAVSFRYPWLAATQAPSKQTATDRKGRIKDAEVTEDTQEPRHLVRNWRSPNFLSAEAAGKQYGNAVHAAMQYIRYENCCSLESVQQEVQRMVSEGFLTAEQGEMVNCDKIMQFFSTQPGQKLRSGIRHLREFKFSILDDGQNYGDSLEGEQVLLQGVVDCALLEEDGITILDFKTDAVTEETAVSAAQRYLPQIQTYAEALSRIYEMPVKRRYLYFFRLNRLWEV